MNDGLIIIFIDVTWCVCARVCEVNVKKNERIHNIEST